MQIRLRNVQSVNQACVAKKSRRAVRAEREERLQLRRHLRIGSKKLVDVAGAGRARGEESLKCKSSRR